MYYLYKKKYSWIIFLFSNLTANALVHICLFLFVFEIIFHLHYFSISFADYLSCDYFGGNSHLQLYIIL